MRFTYGDEQSFFVFSKRFCHLDISKHSSGNAEGLSLKNGRTKRGCDVPALDVLMRSGIFISKPVVDRVIFVSEINDKVCARCAVHKATSRRVLSEGVGKSSVFNGYNSTSC